MKILLIEDSQACAELWRSRYEQLGFPDPRIQHVTRLSEALALLEAGEAYDLIVLDVNLPDHAGDWKSARDAIRKHVGEKFPIQIYTADSTITKRQVERIDPYASISYKFGTELNSFRQSVADALPENRIRRDVDVAIAELKTNQENLWRELSETKKEISEQFAQLRNLIQRSQDQVLVATQDLPEMRAAANAEFERIKANITKMESLVNATSDELRNLEDFRLLVGVAAKLVRFCAEHKRLWVTLAGLAGVGMVPALRSLLEAISEALK